MLAILQGIDRFRLLDVNVNVNVNLIAIAIAIANASHTINRTHALCGV